MEPDYEYKEEVVTVHAGAANADSELILYKDLYQADGWEFVGQSRMLGQGQGVATLRLKYRRKPKLR